MDIFIMIVNSRRQKININDYLYFFVISFNNNYDYFIFKNLFN